MAQLLSREAPPTEFLQLAKGYQSRGHGRPYLNDVIKHCERKDYGCARDNVEELADPGNWSPDVIREGRKPRIALKMRINQRGNFVISHNSAWDRIVFPEDFSRRFRAEQSLRGWHRAPDPCNLMWVPEFGGLLSSARATRNPVAQSLVAAIHARIRELVTEVTQKLTLVAATDTDLKIEDGQIIGLHIEESDETLRLEDEMRYRE